MDFSGAGTLSLEASCSLLLTVFAYKIYKMKINTHSGCCGGALTVETSNPGAAV